MHITYEQNITIMPSFWFEERRDTFNSSKIIRMLFRNKLVHLPPSPPPREQFKFGSQESWTEHVH